MNPTRSAGRRRKARSNCHGASRAQRWGLPATGDAFSLIRLCEFIERLPIRLFATLQLRPTRRQASLWSIEVNTRQVNRCRSRNRICHAEKRWTSSPHRQVQALQVEDRLIITPFECPSHIAGSQTMVAIIDALNDKRYTCFQVVTAPFAIKSRSTAMVGGPAAHTNSHLFVRPFLRHK